MQEAAVCLSELEQSPPAAVLKSIQPFLDAVIKPEILKHQDKDVKLLVASCVSEITRVTAPEAPYSDSVMKVACPEFPLQPRSLSCPLLIFFPSPDLVSGYFSTDCERFFWVE